MNIWYVNHYIIRPTDASDGRPYCIARAFAARGHQVSLIGASHHHLMSPESADSHHPVHLPTGVRYSVLPTRAYTTSRVKRLFNMLDFARAIRSLPHSQPAGQLPTPEVIIASSPHLFTYPAARRLARHYGSKIIFEVRDIWPQSLIEVGGLPSWHPVIFWMSRIERMAYRTADWVVSLPSHAREYMVARGLANSRFSWIPNGISPQNWQTHPEPLPTAHQEIFDQYRTVGKFIVVYAGAMGIPNALDTVLDLHRQADSNRPYHFILIGDGIYKGVLEDRIRRDKIDFVTLLPRITKRQIRSAFAQADACYISLKDQPVFRYGVTPNKLGDYFMAGRPVIYAINAINNMVAEANAGISIPPEDPPALDDAVRTLAAMNQEDREQMGTRGRQYALEHLNWDNLGERYVSLCERLTSRS